MAESPLSKHLVNGSIYKTVLLLKWTETELCHCRKKTLQRICFSTVENMNRKRELSFQPVQAGS
jgi:hypothetical protein